jgi:lipopolysaccharide biosynthesis regulator YciM
MDKDTKDFLVAAGSVALGMVILKELLKEKKYFKCPTCNYPVTDDMQHCPNCKQTLNWGGTY